MTSETTPLTREGLQAIVDGSPYHRWLGLRVTQADARAQKVVIELPHRGDFDRADGASQFHGGIIATLIDTTGDMATALVAGGPVPTIAIHVDYLRPASGTITAQAQIRRAGRTLAVVDIEVTDGSDKLVAIGRGNYSTRTG